MAAEARRLLLALLLAAGCSSEKPVQEKSAEELRREIEAVATPPTLKKEAPRFRLAPISAAEVQAYAGDRPACVLLLGDRMLFVTNGNQGLARIDGQLRRLIASGPVGPTGGFFSIPGATVSIGRIGHYAAGAEAYVPAWTVAVAVGGSEGKPGEFDAGWTCRRRLTFLPSR
jgi:hypothetical protein